VEFDFVLFAIRGLRKAAALPGGDVVLPELRFIDCALE
jgi:hypothetical protein